MAELPKELVKKMMSRDTKELPDPELRPAQYPGNLITLYCVDIGDRIATIFGVLDTTGDEPEVRIYGNGNPAYKNEPCPPGLLHRELASYYSPQLYTLIKEKTALGETRPVLSVEFTKVLTKAMRRADREEDLKHLVTQADKMMMKMRETPEKLVSGQTVTFLSQSYAMPYEERTEQKNLLLPVRLVGLKENEDGTQEVFFEAPMPEFEGYPHQANLTHCSRITILPGDTFRFLPLTAKEDQELMKQLVRRCEVCGEPEDDCGRCGNCDAHPDDDEGCDECR